MLSLFRFINSKIDNLDNESGELSNIIERGEITPFVLAKFCMPKKKTFYDFNFFTDKEIIELYTELKKTNSTQLEFIIDHLVLPEFKFWSPLCVLHFENIIKQKNLNIDYNHIYQELHKLLKINNNIVATTI